MSKVLVVAPSWIGDAVISQTLLALLRQGEPRLEIEVMAPPWVAPVYARMPEVASVLDNPFRHGELRLADRFRIGRELARRGYARCYVLPNSLKSALIPFFAGIPERIGFSGEARYGLVNRRHRLDPVRLPQMAQRFAALAFPPGAELPDPLPLPRLRVDAGSRDAALAALGLDRPPRLAVFCPGAEYGPAKRWPAHHFADLAKLHGARGYAVWLLGSGKEAAIGEEIERRAEGTATNLCGRTDLAQAIDLLSCADFAVTNDSGLMHVAAALGLPLAAVYGSSSPGFTPPLSPRARVVSLALPCSPCFKRDCPLGHTDCLERLPAERVDAALQTLLHA